MIRHWIEPDLLLEIETIRPTHQYGERCYLGNIKGRVMKINQKNMEVITGWCFSVTSNRGTVGTGPQIDSACPNTAIDFILGIDRDF